MRKRRPTPPWLLLIPALLPGAGVLGIGLVETAAASLGWIPALGLNSVSLKAYEMLVGRADFWSDLRYTLIFACCAAAGSVATGSLVAWGLAGCRHAALRRWSVFWVIMAVILPYGIAAQGVQSFLGQSGLIASVTYSLGLIHSPGDFPVLLLTPAGLGLFWPYLWKGSAFTVLILRPYYDRVRSSLEDEARTLGAGGLKLWAAVYVPSGAGAMALVGSVIYAYVFGGLEIPIWLGALNPKLMPAWYYTFFMHPDIGRIPERMALVMMMAVIGLCFSAAFGVCMHILAKRGFGYRMILRGTAWLQGGAPRHRIGMTWGSTLSKGLLAGYGLLMGLPLIWLLLTGLNPALRFPNLIPARWQIVSSLEPVLRDPLLGKALLNGVIVAGMTGLYTAVAAFPAGRALSRYVGFRGEGLARILCGLPLILPSIVIVTGAQLCAIRFGFYGTCAAVVLCHCTLTLPYAVGIQAIYQKQLGVLQEQAARTLGATPWQTAARVLVPMGIPPFVISFSLSFLISFTETFSTQLVGNGRIITLGALLGPALEYGDRARGSGYMLLFILINGLVFYLSHRVARSQRARWGIRHSEEVRHAGN